VETRLFCLLPLGSGDNMYSDTGPRAARSPCATVTADSITNFQQSKCVCVRRLRGCATWVGSVVFRPMYKYLGGNAFAAPHSHTHIVKASQSSLALQYNLVKSVARRKRNMVQLVPCSSTEAVSVSGKTERIQVLIRIEDVQRVWPFARNCWYSPVLWKKYPH